MFARTSLQSRAVTKTAKFAMVSLLLLGPLAAQGSTAPELGAIYDRALREVKTGCYSAALHDLDELDALVARPEDKTEALNLRGLVLTRQREYEGAEIILRRAIEIDPQSWNASFNLAEIAFLKKDWAEARRRFTAMLADPQNGLEEETRQLIDYKILLTCVLDGSEGEAQRMLDQQARERPAFYYLQAAIARQHGNEAGAANWMAAAQQNFAATLNKLYAESFYEIGWEKKPLGESRESFAIVPAGQLTARTEAAARAEFEEAERAFLERRNEAALTLLDRLDQSFPGRAVSYNLRGEILLDERKLDDAEAMLCKALAADPKLRRAAYNLAQIAFKKKHYAQARDQLELLFSETPGGESQVAQLIKFEIFLTFLLEGKDALAQQMMEQFKFTGATPALYYAQAAWAFQHATPERANDWIDSARRIYPAALNLIFADSFYDLGWLENRSGETTAPPLAASSPEVPASSPSRTAGVLRSMNQWPASPADNLGVSALLHQMSPLLSLVAPPYQAEAPLPLPVAP